MPSAWRRTARRPPPRRDRRRRRTATPPRARARRRASRASWPGAYGALPGAAGGETARSTSATRSRSRCGSCASRPAAREHVQARFRYVLVDEFQDTNRAQAELVALVAQRHRNVTVVGDDDQSIYKFRGRGDQQHPRVPGALPERARVVVLRRNYRSRAPILDASYRLVRHNDPDRLEVRAGIVKKLVAERGRDGAPRGPPRGVRDAARRRRTGSPRTSRGGSRGGGAAAGRRDPGARERRPRTRSCARSTSRGSRGGSPAPAASTRGRRSGSCCRSCARSRTRARPWTCTRSPRPSCTAWAARTWSRIVEHGAPPEPERVRDPRGAGPPAGDPAPGAGDAGGAGPAGRGPARATSSSRTSGRPARCCTRSCAGAGWLKRLAEAETVGRRGGAVQHRPLLRHRARPVGAPRRTTGRSSSRRHLQTLIQAGDDPRHGGHRPRRGRGRGDDRPQGEGPRVPGRVPAGPGDGPVPGRRPARAAGAARGARATRRCPRATTSSRRSAACSTWA